MVAKAFGLMETVTLAWRNRKYFRRSRGALTMVLAVLTASALFAKAQPVHAQDPVACQGSFSGTNWIVLDCRPGYVTGYDRILIYRRDGVRADQPWADQLDYSNAVWMFDPGATGHFALIVDFHREAAGSVADLYDDGDGDRSVAFDQTSHGPVPTESGGHWTVRVTAPDGWWVQNGNVNFNLDILIDGPVRGSFGSGFLYDYQSLLKTDGHIDFVIHVRDPDGDGRPDYEWRQDYPPLPEDPHLSGYYRTSIMADTTGDEVLMSGGLFWPYLAATPTGFVKDYNSSPPPIQVDWASAKITQVSEFVASRGKPGNFFIYSINRVHEGQTTASNFENPFAFYDLSGLKDGWPDMSIRFEANLPGDNPNGNYPLAGPLNNVQVTWDQFHGHNWTYEVTLTGRQAVTDVIRFPEFSINAVPPAQLPNWVSGHTWDAATFVQVEKQPYWNSEQVYEWTTNQGGSRLPFGYVTGLDSTPPTKDFSAIQAGFRGEYTFFLNAQPFLYFSPVDARLHLVGASHGIYNVDGQRRVEYSNLASGDYVDAWQTYNGDQLDGQLYQLPGYILYASRDQVSLLKADVPQQLFRTLPPADHAQWASLGAQLNNYRRDFRADDLTAMAAQFSGPQLNIKQASLSDVRLTKSGFRFVLKLVLGYQVQGNQIPQLAGLQPGQYLVQYAGAFVVEPLRPAQPVVETSTLSVSATNPKVLEPVRVDAVLGNAGSADLSALTVQFVASGPQNTTQVITTEVGLLAGQPVPLHFDWTPTLAGEWRIHLSWSIPGATDSATTLGLADLTMLVQPQPLPGTTRLLQMSNINYPWEAILLLGSIAISAAAVAITAVRRGRANP